MLSHPLHLFPQNPVWVFGVCTPLSQTTFSTSYTLVITHSHSPILLLDGIPQSREFVRKNETRPFLFPVIDFTKVD